MANLGDIATLALTAQEYAQLGVKLGQEEMFSLADYQADMPCSNPKCKRGGFSFVTAMRNMAKHAKTSGNGSVPCKGKVTVQGTGMKDQCRHFARWTATVSYKGAHVTP